MISIKKELFAPHNSPELHFGWSAKYFFSPITNGCKVEVEVDRTHCAGRNQISLTSIQPNHD